MANIRRPRHSTKQYWPRKRSRKVHALVKSWISLNNVKLLGFAGYKAGMTNIIIKDNRPNSIDKGDQVSIPVTVIECPILKIFSVKFYKKSPYGKNVLAEIQNSKLDKSLSRKVNVAKKIKDLSEIEGRIGDFDDLRIVVYTLPKKTGLGKKTPDIFELGIGGKNINEKFEFVKGIWNSDLRVSDVFKSGIKVDIHSITTGKGFQGGVKRFGLQLRSHKSEKKRRGAVYGPERPGKILWGALMPGKMGFLLRTEHNKDVMFIGNKPEEINPKGGFLHYGNVRSDYVLLKGSVPGPAKRLITMIEPQRKTKVFGNNYEIQHVNLESKQ